MRMTRGASSAAAPELTASQPPLPPPLPRRRRQQLGRYQRFLQASGAGSSYPLFLDLALMHWCARTLSRVRAHDARVVGHTLVCACLLACVLSACLPACMHACVRRMPVPPPASALLSSSSALLLLLLSPPSESTPLSSNLSDVPSALMATSRTPRTSSTA